MMELLQRRSSSKKQKDGVAIGTRQIAGDPGRAEPVDNAKRFRYRAGVDEDDAAALATFLAYLIMIITAAGTLGLSVRLFLWAAGFREGLF